MYRRFQPQGKKKAVELRECLGAKASHAIGEGMGSPAPTPGTCLAFWEQHSGLPNLCVQKKYMRLPQGLCRRCPGKS